MKMRKRSWCRGAKWPLNARPPVGIWRKAVTKISRPVAFAPIKIMGYLRPMHERVVVLRGAAKALCLVVVILLLLFFVPAAFGATSAPVTSGTSYSVSTLPATGKISAFNGMLVLSYPKNNTLVDQYRLPVSDQSVTFTVYLAGGGSLDPRSYILVSNIYRISVVQGAYLLYPGQLTLTYDSSVNTAVADQLAIWYSPTVTVSSGTYQWDATAGNIILGGVTNSKNNTITAPFQFSGNGAGYYAVFLAQCFFEDFNDPTYGWSSACVLPLWAKGLVEVLPLGRTDNYFGLATDVNRLEFATMLIRGLGYPLTKAPASESEQVFTDTFGTVKFYQARPADIDGTYFGSGYSSVSGGVYIFDANHLPVQYVETAARNGIITGYSDKTFRPQNKLTRQEAAVILSRVVNLRLMDDGEKVQAELSRIFEDADQIAPWAAASVLAAHQAKLIVGKPSADPKSKKLVFDPGGNLTRAEAITLTYRIMKKLKKI